MKSIKKLYQKEMSVLNPSTPLVSIIIPVYNAAPDLATCIESVRRQRYQHIEVLLVNDGSSDASLHICRMYAEHDPRFCVIDKKNSGVSATRNLAIERARGQYLQFVDSDDWLDANATRLLVERAEETGADLVISHFCRVVDDKISVHGFLQSTRVMDQRLFARHLLDEPSSFYYGVMWNKLYRRELIMAHDIRCNEALQWSEDFQFNLEYIRYAQTFCALQTPIYYYRKRSGSLTGALTLGRTVTTKLSLFEYYRALYTSLGLYEQFKPQIYRYLIASAKDN